MTQAQEYLLDNGLRVILLANHSFPTVTMQGWIPSGWANNTRNRHIASLVSGLLKNGTQLHSREEFEDCLDEFSLILRIGSSESSPFLTQWNAKSLSQDVSHLFALTFEALTTPSFPEEELSILKKRKESVLRISAADPTREASQEASRMIYPDGHLLHPLDPEESLRQLGEVTGDDLHRFHNTSYGPVGSGIAVVGDFDEEEILAMIDVTFGQWAQKHTFVTGEYAPPPKDFQYEERVVFIPEKENAEVRVAQYVDLDRKNPDYVALNAAVNILGSGMTSRLFEEVREKSGLSYSVRASLSPMMTSMPAHFYAFAHTNPENIHRAQEKMQEVISLWYQEGITQEELDNEVAGQLGLNAYYSSTMEYVATLILLGEILGESDFGKRDMDKLRELTVEEVNAVISKYLDPATMKVVRAGSVD